ncbi:hypothetical protein C8R45DRAFT_512105 [Mycena sanguinolenta]|nr:hypothetical protein C8R45DRAFT_512105 [Mycena sanguinolenta]
MVWRLWTGQLRSMRAAQPLEYGLKELENASAGKGKGKKRATKSVKNMRGAKGRNCSISFSFSVSFSSLFLFLLVIFLLSLIERDRTSPNSHVSRTFSIGALVRRLTSLCLGRSVIGSGVQKDGSPTFLLWLFSIYDFGWVKFTKEYITPRSH